jgi:hypothetical protein
MTTRQDVVDGRAWRLLQAQRLIDSCVGLVTGQAPDRRRQGRRATGDGRQAKRRRTGKRGYPLSPSHPRPSILR